MKIKVTTEHQVDIWFAEEDHDEHEAAGWMAMVRMDTGADLCMGPYDTKKELVAAINKRFKVKP